MSLNEVKQKVIQIAHEFVQKYGEEALQLSYDELISYLTSFFNYEEWLIFKHNEIEMLRLFLKTVKEDLSKS
ncbi:hypothetical protein CCL42_gp36 [Sulfolobus islandicus rod-shaped virus 8]|uniref:Uncharacterized protein n=1 Tax=Sulfolobus islandicus rod-shaped virus 8 TaxID=1983551 RepID=A0A1X9SJP0_9VIRU|nr:hypothetical protein CCL42_gp36 [Sulfolobus islandicus rod-shaped virus 8]ARQ96442.1 hypothetical protein [Sulfolobus islandicus rod-shaped virus 8]